MPSPSILAFVEGSMEALFINRNFRYVRVVPIKNGCGWSVPALCEQIRTFFKARNFSGDHVTVWLDRESRVETSAQISDAIRAMFTEEGLSTQKLSIMVCDKMTENVILADENFIREEFALPDYAYDAEGTGGKHRLSELFKRAGVSYKETFHGSNCLKKIRLRRSGASSPSVLSFLNSMTLDCWWLDGGVAR